MKAIAGISNVNPLILDTYLSRYERKTKMKLRKQIIHNRVAIKRNVDVIFAMTFKSVMSNLKDINMSNAVVIVFDSPFLLISAGVRTLDAIVNKSMSKHKFIEFTEDKFAKFLTTSLNRSNSNFIPIKSEVDSYLLNSKGESIAQMLLTITLPASENSKKRITITLVRWLMDKNRDVKLLIESMESLLDLDSMVVLGKFIESDTCKNTVAVFDSIREGMKEKEIKSLCKERGIPSFDVLYLLSQIQSNRGK